MQSTRRSLLYVIAASACLAIASAVSYTMQAMRGIAAVITSRVLLGLTLFTDPKPQLQAAPDVRIGLTARQRHDLNDGPAMRPAVSPRWRMCPST